MSRTPRARSTRSGSAAVPAVLAIPWGASFGRGVRGPRPGRGRGRGTAPYKREGARVYLTRQYTIIAAVGVVIFIVLFAALGYRSALLFLVGAACSAAA